MNIEPHHRRLWMESLINDARPTGGVYETTDWITEEMALSVIERFDRAHSEQALVQSVMRELKQLEGRQAQSMNYELRHWVRQPPLDQQEGLRGLLGLGHMPIVIDRKRKCRFDSITEYLLDDAASWQESQARAEYGERLVLVDAMRIIARLIRRTGHNMVGELDPDTPIDLFPGFNDGGGPWSGDVDDDDDGW